MLTVDESIVIPVAGEVQVITRLPEPPTTLMRSDAERPIVVLKVLLDEPAMVGVGLTTTVST